MYVKEPAQLASGCRYDRNRVSDLGLEFAIAYPLMKMASGPAILFMAMTREPRSFFSIFFSFFLSFFLFFFLRYWFRILDASSFGLLSLYCEVEEPDFESWKPHNPMAGKLRYQRNENRS